MDDHNQSTLNQIQRIARHSFKDAKGSHDWDHTQRVVDLCRRLGPMENADMFLLLSAAYLHDIGRAEQDHTNGSVCHAAKGARLAADCPGFAHGKARGDGAACGLGRLTGAWPRYPEGAGAGPGRGGCQCLSAQVAKR